MIKGVNLMEKVIKLSGRLSNSNGVEVNEFFAKEIGDFKGDLVFDTLNLEYISSLGLRMIMKLLKEKRNIRSRKGGNN